MDDPTSKKCPIHIGIYLNGINCSNRYMKDGDMPMNFVANINGGKDSISV